MNDKHVVSLELSKKLKEVGYPQGGEFWWVKYQNDGEKWNVFSLERLQDYANHHCGYPFGEERFLASLASELMEKLPKRLEVPEKDLRKVRVKKLPLYEPYVASLCIEWTGKKADIYSISYIGSNWLPIIDTNLCNALAKMYIYLAENKLLKQS